MAFKIHYKTTTLDETSLENIDCLPEGECTDELLARKPGFLLSAMDSRAFRWFSATPSVFFFFNIFLGDFLFFFIQYSALLHLPPLRFHCADGCWDRTQDRCNQGVYNWLQLLHWQSDALTTRLDLIRVFLFLVFSSLKIIRFGGFCVLCMAPNLVSQIKGQTCIIMALSGHIRQGPAVQGTYNPGYVIERETKHPRITSGTYRRGTDRHNREKSVPSTPPYTTWFMTTFNAESSSYFLHVSRRNSPMSGGISHQRNDGQ